VVVGRCLGGSGAIMRMHKFRDHTTCMIARGGGEVLGPYPGSRWRAHARRLPPPPGFRPRLKAPVAIKPL